MADIPNNQLAVSTALAGSFDPGDGEGTGTGALRILGTFEVGDVAIGGVEIKDGASDTRAKVADGTTIVAADNALAVKDAAVSAKLPAALGQAAMAASMSVAIASNQSAVAVTPAATESYLGAVGSKSKVFAATAFVCDTSAYSSGDVLTDALEFDNAVRVNDGTGWLTGFTLIDEDDQGVAMDIYIMDANVSLGTKNSAPSISDANARNILGVVSVASTDWKDLGGVRVAFKSQLALQIVGGTGTKKIWIAAVNGTGTPTFTASGLRIRPYIMQD